MIKIRGFSVLVILFALGCGIHEASTKAKNARVNYDHGKISEFLTNSQAQLDLSVHLLDPFSKNLKPYSIIRKSGEVLILSRGPNGVFDENYLETSSPSPKGDDIMTKVSVVNDGGE